MTSRIALITGANRGLGRSAALHLASAGTDIVLTYRSNADEARAVVDEITALGRQAVALQLDVSRPAEFAAFAEDVRRELSQRWGRERFDVLVNNAGHADSTPIGGSDVGVVESLIAVHFTGVVMLTQALLPLLADGGRVLNTSSGLARFTGDGGLSVYAAAKGAVEVYTRYLAKELGPSGITANVIAPGPIATDFGGGMVRDVAAVRDHLAGAAALGRVGEADDIGRAVVALVSSDLSFMTGTRIEVSGGTYL